MNEPTSLRHQFLIAMPALDDPNFFQTVTYITEHDSNGALGLVINRPLNMNLGQLLDHLDINATTTEIAATPVYYGGPVQPEQGFVLHSPLGCWDSTLRLTTRLGVTTSRDILHAVAEGTGPRHLLVILGYAGWGPGQLEREMAENAWLSTAFDFDILFTIPHAQRWQAAASLLGVNLHLLSSHVGHA